MSPNASATTVWAGGEVVRRGSFFSLLTGSLCRQWGPGKSPEVQQVLGDEKEESEGAQDLLLQDGVQGFGRRAKSGRDNIRAVGFAGALSISARTGSML